MRHELRGMTYVVDMTVKEKEKVTVKIVSKEEGEKLKAQMEAKKNKIVTK